ncbi:YbaK/EbsC family protein [Roseovarius sp. A21]|uniref:YbaK/EbsC family protein n=1 Tax=Roseovarius bejariae TaxID=2576383 RepID=A0A844CPW0_9RHOB|nr:YbaK/EbsC family protein [Roseovarius bejariae]MRU16887.1 YbaK/EbsC family protein [Roseovarius bejariae]
MSKSLKRVKNALVEAGCEIEPREIGQATTAQMAADLVGCAIDQIAKSIIFRGEMSGEAVLFVTAGGNQVNADRAATLAGEPLGKADAGLIRAQTGFAIGGVSPVGHLTPPRAFFDPRLLDFETVWAAAGTPRHLFGISPDLLMRISGALSGKFTA